MTQTSTFSDDHSSTHATRPPAGGRHILSGGMLGTILQGVDTLAIAAGTMAIPLIVLQLPLPDISFAYVLIIAIAITVQHLRRTHTYQFALSDDAQTSGAKLAGTWLTSVCIASAPMLAFDSSSGARGASLDIWLACALFGGGGGLLCAHMLTRHWLRHWRQRGHFRHHIAIIGAGEHGRRLIEHLRSTAPHVAIVGLFDDRHDRLPGEVSGVHVAGGIEALMEHARLHPIDEIVVALPKGAGRRVSDWSRRLSVLPTTVSLCPDIGPMTTLSERSEDLAGLSLTRLSRRPLDGWGYVIKAAEDRILGLLLLIAFAPLMLTIALAIRITSPGPILFRQERHGFNGNVIRVLKFRSMRVDSGPLAQARAGDPRITPIGRHLRRTSLDELPQLVNVVRGEMSLVGPRPHAVAHDDHYAQSIDSYLSRHRVKPGITGWAQVNGWRGETDTLEKMRARIEHDLHYIENWSLAFDLKILGLTAIVGFRHPNAY